MEHVCVHVCGVGSVGGVYGSMCMGVCWGAVQDGGELQVQARRCKTVFGHGVRASVPALAMLPLIRSSFV